MKRLILYTALISVLLGNIPAFAAKGVVSYIKRGCSYYIVKTNMGYALLQWFGGSTPLRDDVLVGDYESYGIKDIYNITQDSETKVWVDNYWMSKDTVIEKYLDKCN